jgi:hypothetical protein
MTMMVDRGCWLRTRRHSLGMCLTRSWTSTMGCESSLDRFHNACSSCLSHPCIATATVKDVEETGTEGAGEFWPDEIEEHDDFSICCDEQCRSSLLHIPRRSHSNLVTFTIPSQSHSEQVTPHLAAGIRPNDKIFR